MIPVLAIKERIEQIAAETGEPIGCIIEGGVAYLAEHVPLRARKAGFDVMAEELAMKVCPVDERNTIASILRNSRVDRRRRDAQRQGHERAAMARKRDMKRRADDAMDALVEDLRTAARGRIITSG